MLLLNNYTWLIIKEIETKNAYLLFNLQNLIQMYRIKLYEKLKKNWKKNNNKKNNIKFLWQNLNKRFWYLEQKVKKKQIKKFIILCKNNFLKIK